MSCIGEILAPVLLDYLPYHTKDQDIAFFAMGFVAFIGGLPSLHLARDEPVLLPARGAGQAPPRDLGRRGLLRPEVAPPLRPHQEAGLLRPRGPPGIPGAPEATALPRPLPPPAASVGVSSHPALLLYT